MEEEKHIFMFTFIIFFFSYFLEAGFCRERLAVDVIVLGMIVDLMENYMGTSRIGFYCNHLKISSIFTKFNQILLNFL